ncbi:NUDIX hydrolase [Pseudoalteromonas mariniglutinosa]|uniref:NUDIX hydrolase n=1 Tax=Pseudoalteromonas mariniglutinosa TaxID=206042 RepID=UPI00384A4647
MNSQYLITRFTLNQPLKAVTPVDQRAKKTASAVVLPLIDVNKQAHILLCKRAAHLTHHPSEICLPGGKFEKNDKNLRDTALRELYEELNISTHNVTVHGQLKQYSTLTGFSITPYVCTLRASTEWVVDHNEVAASFLVPVNALLQPENWQPLPLQLYGRTVILDGFATSHGILWGATASIIKNFTKQLAIPV